MIYGNTMVYCTGVGHLALGLMCRRGIKGEARRAKDDALGRGGFLATTERRPRSYGHSNHKVRPPMRVQTPPRASSWARLLAFSKTTTKRAPTGGALFKSSQSQGSADLAQKGRHAVLGVAIEHPRVLLEEQRVLDAGIAGALAPLRHEDVFRLPDLQHRHTGDGVDRKPHRLALPAQLVGQFADRLLRLGHGHAVAGHDDD